MAEFGCVQSRADARRSLAAGRPSSNGQGATDRAGVSRCQPAFTTDSGAKTAGFPVFQGKSSRGKSAREHAAESQACFEGSAGRDTPKCDGSDTARATCQRNRLTIGVSGVLRIEHGDATDAEVDIAIRHHQEMSITEKIGKRFPARR